jgi:hypothetical protein
MMEGEHSLFGERRNELNGEERIAMVQGVTQVNASAAFSVCNTKEELCGSN